mmetsp:Transcript_16205/g.26434  ORF Transcript_16205/g.26434 Transcript_16205/m.26434 type:complete len:332 (-) Transcript_16205:1160-2155(-)
MHLRHGLARFRIGNDRFGRGHLGRNKVRRVRQCILMTTFHAVNHMTQHRSGNLPALISLTLPSFRHHLETMRPQPRTGQFFGGANAHPILQILQHVICYIAIVSKLRSQLGRHILSLKLPPIPMTLGGLHKRFARLLHARHLGTIGFDQCIEVHHGSGLGLLQFDGNLISFFIVDLDLEDLFAYGLDGAVVDHFVLEDFDALEILVVEGGEGDEGECFGGFLGKVFGRCFLFVVGSFFGFLLSFGDLLGGGIFIGFGQLIWLYHHDILILLCLICLLSLFWTTLSQHLALATIGFLFLLWLYIIINPRRFLVKLPLQPLLQIKHASNSPNT